MIARELEAAQWGHSDPSDAPAEMYTHVGLTLGKKGDLEGAAGMFEKAIAIRPDFAQAWNNLGVAQKGLGDVGSAIRNFRQAIQLSPDYVEAHWNLSFLLLLTGEFEEGWQEYEWWFRKRQWIGNLKDLEGIPKWDGSSFQGKRLLVYGEQGFGDTLQFVRYMIRVKALGGTVILKTQPVLAALLSSVYGVDQVIDGQPDSPLETQFDAHIPILSLPGIFRTTPKNIPGRGLVPYIHADSEKAAHWRQRLENDCFKVGLIWAGKETDPNRACPLVNLAPLADMEGVAVYGLQKGEAARQMADLPQSTRIVDLGDRLDDFSDTAAAMESLDLVVSVDTAAAHLAGAMGKPTFTLIPFAPDWRWFLGREDSPWYPTMRLFRQQVRGNWGDAINHLMTAVRDQTRLQMSSGEQQGASSQGRSRSESRDGRTDVKMRVDTIECCRQSGRIQEALEQAEHLVSEVPENWEALHLLTILYHQTGQRERFGDILSRASSAKSGTDALLLSLGNLFKGLGHIREALSCYQGGLQVNPGSAAIHYNMGNAFKDQKDFQTAVSCYLKAIVIDPDFEEAYYNMGNTYREMGEQIKALSCYQKAMALDPDHIAAIHNAGLILKDLKRFDEAVACYGDAIKSRPDSADLHYNLGNIYKEQEKFQDALISYRKAIQLDPEMVDAHYNMGNVFKASRSFRQAISCYERVLEIKPDHFGAMNNMGLTYRDWGKLDRAIHLFDRALKIKPDHVEIRWNRALALLLRGDLAEGWQEYEVRFKRGDLTTTYPRQLNKPSWDGSSFASKRLLVHHEQGLGDTLQFVRYLPAVKKQGGTVILEVHEALHSLCQCLNGVDEIVSGPMERELDVKYDICIPIMSLPRICGTTLETIPTRIPYIQADPDISAFWKTQLNPDQLSVGLVWSGNPGHKDDKNRSCPLKLLEPLTRIPGVRLYGLQKSVSDKSERLMKELGITHLGEALEDFAVTAGIIANLDLTISVDTAVAHLAGAMGKPIWLLLPFVPDWRWLLDRDDSPWYPTMRLFRQVHAGIWEEVIGRVADDLKRLSSKNSILSRTRKACGRETLHSHPTAPVPSEIEALMADALAHYQAGRWQEAWDVCEKITLADSDHAKALHMKGLLYHRQGAYDKAIDVIQKAIKVVPDQAVYFNNLGAAYMEKGSSKKAAACYHRALQLKPDVVEAHHNLGKAAMAERRFDEAVSWFQRAVALRNDYHEAHSKMGEALMELRRYQDAVACGKRLIEIAPQRPDGHFIMGNGLKEMDHFEPAIESYEAALAIDPRHVQSLVHMGLCFQSLGQIDNAIDAFDRALEIDKVHPDANLNRALIRLLSGDYENGWKGYEWRFSIDDWKRRHPRRPIAPRWDGSACGKGSVIIHHEQGFGDAIQFSRYLPMVMTRGRNVVFEVNRRLLRLFRGLTEAEGLRLVPVGQCALKDITGEIPLLSLPGLFGTTLKTIPSEIPYLRAEADLIYQWSRRLNHLSGFRIGISWQGNPAYRDDRHRSVPLKHFEPLASVDGVTLVSLQKGHGLDQMRHIGHDVSIVNLGPDLDNGDDAFVDTAAVIKTLDLVITSDTALPHLAGALGVPMWMVLPHVPDWRWGLSGETCPWYPTMRLFRQETPNDWDRVFQRVRRALVDMVQNRT